MNINYLLTWHILQIGTPCRRILMHARGFPELFRGHSVSFPFHLVAEFSLEKSLIYEGSHKVTF